MRSGSRGIAQAGWRIGINTRPGIVQDAHWQHLTKYQSKFKSKPLMNLGPHLERHQKKVRYKTKDSSKS